jgi:2-octaprenyl-6-methoxyphenol hydroxylase
MHNKYDLIISGAGYIGLTFACLLANKGLRIAVIDKKRPNTDARMPSDSPGRLFSIAAASLEIFKDAGIENELTAFAEPIKQIVISDNHHSEQLIFDPSEIGLNNFGCMIDEGHILKALITKVQQHKNILFCNNAEIKSINNTSDHVQLELSDGQLLSSKLLVIAEGKNSKTRKMLGIETRNIDYHQDAMVCDIEHEIHHQGRAVEKFLPSGPFAILPKTGGYTSCIVWTNKTNTGKLMSAMSSSDVECLLKGIVGDDLGKIKLSSGIIHFPLSLLYAKEYVQDRVALCGDTLHSVHPIAGQGFNLGLRDIKLLSQLIEENIDLGLDIGSKKLLGNYGSQRSFDTNLMINSTHSINAIFSSDFLPVKLLGKVGTRIINRIKPLKNYIMNYASGYKY